MSYAHTSIDHLFVARSSCQRSARAVKLSVKDMASHDAATVATNTPPQQWRKSDRTTSRTSRRHGRRGTRRRRLRARVGTFRQKKNVPTTPPPKKRTSLHNRERNRIERCRRRPPGPRVPRAAGGFALRKRRRRGRCRDASQTRRCQRFRRATSRPKTATPPRHTAARTPERHASPESAARRDLPRIPIFIARRRPRAPAPPWPSTRPS